MSLVPSNKITASIPACAKTSRPNLASAFCPQQGELVSTRLPPIPAFSTAVLVSPASRRRARTSVQRSFLSGREDAPSVIESPSATTAAFTSAGASTSTALRKYHDPVVFDPVVFDPAATDPVAKENAFAPSSAAKLPAPEI